MTDNFLNSLLDKQQVKKRKKNEGLVFSGKKTSHGRSGKRSSKPAFRPKGIAALVEQNSGFIKGIKQEPVKQQRRSVPVRPAAAVKSGEQNEQRDGSLQRERSWGSFALSVVSITAVFFIIIGIFFIIHTQDGLDWAGRDVVSVTGDSASQTSLARYAGLTLADTLLDSDTARNLELVEAIPLDLMETFEWQTYRVRRGDSVSTIAQAFSVSMDAIIASNGITNARALREGETLRIPNMDGIPHVVRSGDSLTGISQSFGVPLEAILDANDIQSNVLTAGTTLFIPGARMNRDELRMALGDRMFNYPVRGARLTSPFGWRNDPFTGVRRHHAAIDLAAPQGTPIMAAKDGRVSVVGYDRVFGNFIIIAHANAYQTLYAHLHTVSVRRGDTVRQGARIGTVGSTGLSTGPHLHFAIYRNNRALNPLDLLNPRH